MTAYLNEVEKQIASNLRIARKIRGFTLEDISKVLEVSSQQVQKYEVGKSRIPIATLLKVAEYLKVDLQFFMKKFDF